MNDNITVDTDENGFRIYKFRGTAYYSRDKARQVRKKVWDRELER